MVGFVVTLLTSIGSCGVSWIALRQAQQANTFQSAVLHQITARIADGKPSRLLSLEEYRPQEVDANFGPIHKIVGVQVEVCTAPRLLDTEIQLVRGYGVHCDPRWPRPRDDMCWRVKPDPVVTGNVGAERLLGFLQDLTDLVLG